jgi:hypothetical protein
MPIFRLALLAALVALPVVAPAQLVLPTLSGTWTYSNPNASKQGDVYQWSSAKAEITQQGDRVEGTYECVYAVPAGDKLTPKVTFSFAGRISSEVMSFELKSPLKGTFRVLRATASELTVAYHIGNAKQQKISFGLIPENAPQVLARQAQ